MPKRVDRNAIHAELRARYGSTITRAQMEEYRRDTGQFPGWFYTEPFGSQHKISRGLYRIPGDGDASSPRPVVSRQSRPRTVAAPRPVQNTTIQQMADDMVSSSNVTDGADLSEGFMKSASVAERIAAIKHAASLLATVPERDPRFVPFGEFDIVRTIISKRNFRAGFITGLSGNGKTFQIRQACAMEQREYIRVNITAETDEDDLIGGFRLVDGNTVFELGPVLVAMIRGAVLCIDEIDYASPKIACLQPVLEGSAITVKKLGITISPEPGFVAFATANTKGRGDDSGRFHGANMLNEAFLDRFHLTIEQDYPSVTVEKKILRKTYEAEGYEMTPHAVTFFDTLCRWAESIRETFKAGGIEDLIATRRLVHIVQMYATFDGDEQKALSNCVNRFDPKTKDAFIDLYNKLAPDAAAESNVPDIDD